MTQFVTPLLTLVLVHGYPIIILIILLGYIGLPLPVDITLLAAGSFSADGTLNFFTLVVLAAITGAVGDIVQYLLCRKYGVYIIQKTFFKKGLTPSRIQKIEKFLNRRGIWWVFLTRWLFSPLGVPVNITAGVINYSFRKFVIAVTFGELLWALLYVSAGYFFGSNWSILVDYIQTVPEFLALIVVGTLLIYASVRIWKSRK